MCRLLSRLDEGALVGLYGRSLLLTREWSRSEIETLLSVAEVFEEFDRGRVATTLFPDELHAALFFDSSTRTKSAWAGAAARLGARPVVMDAATSQIGHGESAEETGTMIGMCAHALGVRHDLILGEGSRFIQEAKKGIEEYLRARGDDRIVPVVNLQCDVDHPTQTLADLAWLGEKVGPDLRGKSIAITWAYSPSYAKPLSVPQGLVALLCRFGMHVRLAYPDGYRLTAEILEAASSDASSSGGSFIETSDMDQAFRGADIVYPKSWGPYDLMVERVDAHRERNPERMKDIERRALERNQSHREWICDERRMALTRGAQGLYMHCLPADIGSEVSAEVMRRFRFDVARQANKKLYVIMAALAAAKQRSLKERLSRLASAAS